MLIKIKSYFPSTRGEWLKYTLTSLPIILAAMISAFNSFIDNFMATNIQGGNQALSYSNQWTNYCSGIVSATTLVGSALFGQYLGLGDNKKLREVIHARTLISLSIAVCFAIPAWCCPEFLINISCWFDKKLDHEIIETGVIYLRIIAISWILNAWFYSYSMIIRETGYGKISLVASITSLTSNIILNLLFTQTIKMGIFGLALSTIIAISLAITIVVIFVWIKDKRLIINPLKLFVVSKTIWIQIRNRFQTFILATIGSLCVSTRFIFWNSGYKTGSIGSNPDYFLSAANILGISGMFFNIFWSTFESLNANVSIFVGRELGNNNFIAAKRNAKQLQGFNLTFAIFVGLIFFAFSFTIEQMEFLTHGYVEQLKSTLIKKYPDNQQLFTQLKPLAIKEYLQNVKWTVWPLSWNMPIWIWYMTKSRIISGGGKTNIVSLVDTCNGIFQISWIAIINLVIVPKTQILFAVAYGLFYMFDFLKVITYEILYYKIDWARNITSEGVNPKSLE